MREIKIEIPANGDRFGTFEGASEAGIALSPLGLVVSEHVDKIGFFEPGVEVLDKEILPDRVRFTLRMGNDGGKSVEEIVRGYKIGCFKIAREYKLITPADPRPIFGEFFSATVKPNEPRKSSCRNANSPRLREMLSPLNCRF